MDCWCSRCSWAGEQRSLSLVVAGLIDVRLNKGKAKPRDMTEGKTGTGRLWLPALGGLRPKKEKNINNPELIQRG